VGPEFNALLVNDAPDNAHLLVERCAAPVSEKPFGRYDEVRARHDLNQADDGRSFAGCGSRCRTLKHGQTTPNSAAPEVLAGEMVNDIVSQELCQGTRVTGSKTRRSVGDESRARISYRKSNRLRRSVSPRLTTWPLRGRRQPLAAMAHRLSGAGPLQRRFSRRCAL